MTAHTKNTWKMLLVAAIALPLAAAKSADTPTLGVKIETPTVFDIGAELDIEDALFAHLDTAFDRSGFEGEIEPIDRLDDKPVDIPTISLRILDWTTRRSGIVECRFTAELATPDGVVENLGTFRGSSVRWATDTRFAVERAYEDAAVNAMRELYEDLNKIDNRSADTAAG
ncbi:MAG: hypothetical protein SynsKO_15430 [Synoicihabitans sp.]